MVGSIGPLGNTFVCARLHGLDESKCDCNDERLRRLWGAEEFHKRSLPMFKCLGRVRNLNERVAKIRKEMEERREKEEMEERLRREMEAKDAKKKYPHRWGVKPAPGACCSKDCHARDQEGLEAFILAFKNARGKGVEQNFNYYSPNEQPPEEVEPNCECEDFVNVFDPSRALRPLHSSKGCNCGQIINWMTLKENDYPPKRVELHYKPLSFIDEISCAKWAPKCSESRADPDAICPPPECCPLIQTCQSPEPCDPIPKCFIEKEEETEPTECCHLPSTTTPPEYARVMTKMVVRLPRKMDSYC